MFIDELKKNNIDFFTGIPDSLLKSFIDCLYYEYGVGEKNIVGVNEGNCVALATGYHLSTGNIPCVYMQNSGIGNAFNPIASLTNDKIYGIPMLFVIGWRGETGIHDEPQHLFQGEITTKSLDLLDIDYFVLDKNSTLSEVKIFLQKAAINFSKGKSAAFIVKKDTFVYDEKIKYTNQYDLCREEVIEYISNNCQEDIFVATTGKISRELFESRIRMKLEHKRDFLTVGSMGHSSAIALSIAINKPKEKVWCLDGDGAALMHLGSMALIGHKRPENYIHVILNNEAHESVGGIPTIAGRINWGQLALACGYTKCFIVVNMDELKELLNKINLLNGPILIEVKVSMLARKDLIRPNSTPQENKIKFMKHLKEIQ